ncbi:putative feruloyl esterase C [Rhypophila decipiens]|uniref:Feruloyl esterase C n=1 Tax=Rhypophila decipiens TaxID=261697 RepID=A0AAN7B3A0_9PEZI|nr:putative feruloyl esterase C [Rhypophila decipiens]
MELKLFSILSLLPALATAKPSVGCGKAAKVITQSTPSTTPLTISSGGRNREYFANLPADYNNSVPHRLILTLHALGGNAGQVIAGQGGYLPFYGLPSAISNSTTYKTDIPTIYIAPNGISNGWANTNNSDVNFIRSLIDTVQSDLCIDTSLVFSTGFSFGAAMSYMLACNLGPEYLRAVAVLSGNPQISGTCPALNAASEGVAFYIQHGTNDQVLPVSGGREMRDRFLKVNGCDVAGTTVAPDPAVGSGAKHTKTDYKGCVKPVTWVAFDGPHTPTPKDPGESETFSPRETWDFFGQFGPLE